MTAPLDEGDIDIFENERYDDQFPITSKDEVLRVFQAAKDSLIITDQDVVYIFLAPPFGANPSSK